MIIDGNLIAKQIKAEVKQQVSKLSVLPRLDVVLVGNDPASEIYVKKKQKACEEVGISSFIHRPTTQQAFFDVICDLNDLKACNGILVQLPLPKSFNSNDIFSSIDVFKDVDVFNPVNVGLLVQNRPRFIPPTPHAVQRMISSVTSLVGKHVVVINRSNIIGRPLSSMLIQDNGEYANATVTVCHDATPFGKLKELCLAADIIVVAVGIPDFLTPDMVRNKHIIIDVGVNRLSNNKIVGDVHLSSKDKVEWISCVPGGVGPWTVGMLLYNVVEATKLQLPYLR